MGREDNYYKFSILALDQNEALNVLLIGFKSPFPLLSYIEKIVISIWVFVFAIITQEPLDRFASNFE